MTAAPAAVRIVGRVRAVSFHHSSHARNYTLSLHDALPILLKGPFTVDHYHRLAELGILDEDERVELLDGQIVEMSPIGPRHAGCVKGLVRLLYRKLGDAVFLGVQDPISLGPRSEPQPDIAVLKPRSDAYRDAHPRPGDILLVIEVAETSVESDRDVKLALYAGAGVPEAWLVDLAND